MRPDAACCCDGCSCQDCLNGAKLVDGCCHSHLCGNELLVLRKNRPEYQRVEWARCTGGQGTCGYPDSCSESSQGCEVRFKQTRSAEEPIQAIYEPLGRYFHVVGGPRYTVTGDRFLGLPIPPRQCNTYCDENESTACCYCDYQSPCPTPDRTGCVCFQGTVGIDSGSSWATWDMSPYQKQVMEEDSKYWVTLGIACYNDGDESLGSPPTAENPNVGTDTNHHLMDHFLGLVYPELWWERSQCEGWFLPDPLCAPRECGTGGCVDIDEDTTEGSKQRSDIVPRYWFYGCAGVPLFGATLCRARDNGDISASECVTLLGQFGMTSSQSSYSDPPSQAILKKLWDAGYIRTSDWREELNDAWTDLSDNFSAYDACKVSDPATLDTVAPCRILGDGITCADAADINEDENPSCCVDPWSGGPYPDPGDADYADYQVWRKNHGYFMHAAQGGWGWGCWNHPNGEIPYIGSARNNLGCFDQTGYPQDPCCENLTASGHFPNHCFTNGCNEDPSECLVPETGCTTYNDSNPGYNVPEYCASTVVRSYCSGVVVYSFEYEQLGVWDSSEETIEYQSRCAVTYSSFLQAIDNSCADWTTAGELYKCRASSDNLGVYAEIPESAKTHYVPLSFCAYLGSGTGTSPNMSAACCGGMCADWSATSENSTFDVKECPPLDGTADECQPLSNPQAMAQARDCYGERGACCVGTTCHDFMRQKDCIALGGTYYSGAHCCDDSDHPQICVRCT